MNEFFSQYEPNIRALKKAASFNHIIPSEDMSIEEYDAFLDCAKSVELELDVVIQETYYKICKQLNKPLPKPNFPQFRYI
jgi:hypothetical protein